MKVRAGFVSNSSSEAFILKTRRNVKRIETELRSIIDLYNTISGEKLEFDNMFKLPQIADKVDEEYLKSWDYKTPLIGKTIIYSAEDNAIPWVIVEFVAAVYNADRIHLG